MLDLCAQFEWFIEDESCGRCTTCHGGSQRAVEIIRKAGGLSRNAWFETIALHEPLKEHLRQGSCPRLAYVCCYDPDVGETWDGIVDLAQARLKDWRHVNGAQARIVIDEFVMGGEIAKADPRFIEACAKRGVTDMNEVLIEPWAAGHFGVPEEKGERLAYGHC